MPPSNRHKPDPRRGATKRYDMKKSINLWAFPYPERMNLRECLQLAKDAGFDGVELNYDLENDLSPKAGTQEFHAIRSMADEIGIAISGLCSFLPWPYPVTSNVPAERERGLELAGLMVRAAHDLGTENLLVVPGAVHIPWRTDHEPTPPEVCDQRARAAITKLLPDAEKLKVRLNIENIVFSGYLMTPFELIAFVDSFQSEYVQGALRYGQRDAVPVPRALDRHAGQANPERASQGVLQEGDGSLARVFSAALGRHHELAGRHRCV